MIKVYSYFASLETKRNVTCYTPQKTVCTGEAFEMAARREEHY